MKDFQKQYSDWTGYPEPHERIRFWDRMFQERVRLEDDNIPSAYPSEFDQGLYGGLLGGDIRYLAMTTDGYVSSGWISSMIPPLLEDWSGFERLEFREDHPLFQRYLTQLGIMKEAASGKFGISHLIAIDSFNFVYELIGATNTYLSVVDHPDMVRKRDRFRLRAEPQDPLDLFRRGRDAGGRDVQLGRAVDPREDHQRERGPLPHDLGRLFRGVGQGAGAAVHRPLRRRRRCTSTPTAGTCWSRSARCEG